MTKKQKLPLSKWFSYGLVVIVLLVAFFYSLYETSLGNEMWARFLPTFFGLLFTLVIFYVFFDLREEREWKPLKEKVYKNIQSELDLLFYAILPYVKDGSMVQEHLVLENPQTRNNLILSELGRVRNMKELGLNATNVKALFEDKATLNVFSTVARNLNDIEIKFWRFLPSGIAPSLEDIRLGIESLEQLIQQHIFLEKMLIVRKTAEAQTFVNTYPMIIERIFQRLIEEMHKTFKMCAEKT